MLREPPVNQPKKSPSNEASALSRGCCSTAAVFGTPARPQSHLETPGPCHTHPGRTCALEVLEDPIMALPCGCSGMSVDTVTRRASFRTVASSCGLFSLVRLIQRTRYVCMYLPTQPSPAFLLYHTLYRVTRREYSLASPNRDDMTPSACEFGISITWATASLSPGCTMYECATPSLTIDNRKYISNSLNPVLCYAMLFVV